MAEPLSSDPPADPPPAIPRATYRIQFRNGFGFAEAEAVVPYLAELGVSHLYASPIFKAREGSTHGYDAVDFNALDPELGDEAAFDGLCQALRRHGMGLLVDFVPNHTGVGKDNFWWQDVLAKGQGSAFAEFFDIDWTAGDGRLILPRLGAPFDEVLANGELELRFLPDIGLLALGYYDSRWPLAPGDVAAILERAGAPAELVDSFAAGSFGAARAALRALVEETPVVGAAIATEIEAVNADPEALRALAQRQAYRLIHWREGPAHLNYRRFFDIDELAALRMDREEVFEASHRLLLRLIAEDKLQGVRLDHIDGLLDPHAYCRRLAEAAAEANGEPRPGIADIRAGRPIYLVVEKILGQGEVLRADLMAAGTTGYEFMTALAELMVDPAGEAPLEAAKAAFGGEARTFEQIAIEAKHEVMEASFPGELDRLAADLYGFALRHEPTRQTTQEHCRAALVDLIAAFRIYRTYIGKDGATAEDRFWIDRAIADAGIEPPLADLLCDVAAGKPPAGASIPTGETLAFAMRLQQITGPVMAKAVEDTAFYRYLRLVSLNDVGGEPGHFGGSIAGFHRWVQEHRASQPHGMLATATHDHKRGEDVRARLHALAAMAGEWGEAARRWQDLNRPLHATANGRPAPSPDDEYLTYQTLLGVWPLELDPADQAGLDALAERVVANMTKAAREAGVETSWIDVDEAYEQALATFIGAVLNRERSAAFLEDFLPLQERVAEAGMVNGLAQTVLKLTLPGVPDIYQGTEFWDLSLVDPDNRRPVAFDRHERLLGAGASWTRLRADWRNGEIKQRLIRDLLAVRRRLPALFREGSFEPLVTLGAHAGRLLAFARRHEGQAILVMVAPVRQASLAPEVDWEDTRLEFDEALAGLEVSSVCADDGETLRLDKSMVVQHLLKDDSIGIFVTPG
jgi:(1->4)-alpha-D-glucan 1-alpha-D-glucosylmutase